MHEEYYPKYPETSTASLVYLRPEQIRTANQPQKSGQDSNAIIRLSASIKRYGVLQPLTVRVVGDFSGYPTYELVDGERRLRAARLLGLEKLPCLVLSGDDKSLATASIFEDLRSGRLHIFEQAAAFRLLGEKFRLTQEEIARKVGVSQSSVANKLRLLRFSQAEQEKILSAGLSERHARALLRLSDPQKRALALEEIIAYRYPVAATESLIEALLSAENTPQAAAGQGGDGAESGQNGRNEGQNTVREGENGGLGGENGGSGGQNGTQMPQNSRQATETPVGQPVFSTILSPEPSESAVQPRKFILHDLQPLYNSIEKILGIFRKTGQSAEWRREEGEESIKIIITIPRPKRK